MVMVHSAIDARAVLSEAASRDGVDDAFFRLGYRLLNVIDVASGRPAQLVFAREADDYVHVVDDGQLGLTYLAIRGAGAEQARAALERSLPCESAEAARRDLVEGALEARARALAVLVLLEPDAADMTELIEAALRDEHVRMRAIGLTAAAYAPCTPLQGVVVAIRDNDREPRLREMAARVVASAFAGVAS